MTSNLTELASTISSNVAQISAHLKDQNQPFPTFASDGPNNLNITSSDVERSRRVAIDALEELLDLLRGPNLCMMPFWNAAPLQVIHRHEIAQKIPMDGKISFEDLAKQCDLEVGNLKRILRHAICFFRLFSEPEVGFVAHSPGSKALAQDEILRAGVGTTSNEFYPAFAKTADALDEFKDQEPKHAGYALAHNTNGSMFDHFRAHPEKAGQFAKAMTCFSKNMPGYSITPLIQEYDWDSLGAGTVVDVGGSDGQVGMALARAFPRLNVIVQDLPDVIATATSQVNGHNELSNIKFQEHDMFKPQPEVADVYLFRGIFNDWPDQYVMNALQSLIPALRKGAKVIINESLSPKPGSLPLSMERFIRHLDMLMLSIANARLRTVEEWNDIFPKADSRFGPVKCSFLEGSALALLEVVWQG